MLYDCDDDELWLVQGLIPEISADEIAAEEPALAESIADEDHEEGELESSPSLHKDLDVFAEDTRTTKIRRIVYVRRTAPPPQTLMLYVVMSSTLSLSLCQILRHKPCWY